MSWGKVCPVTTIKSVYTTIKYFYNECFLKVFATRELVATPCVQVITWSNLDSKKKIHEELTGISRIGIEEFS